MRQTCLIVGAGQCGLQTAESLRELGYPGRVLMVGEERHLPYQRPPLSKRIAEPGFRADDLWFRPADSLAKSSIELRLGVRATRIVRDQRVVEVSDGGGLAYDRLVLATGASVRRIAVPGASLRNVCYLHTLDEAIALRAALLRARKVIVIGGGYIGLEVAAMARIAGAGVTVLESGVRLLGRVASPELSEYVACVHRSHGVEVVCDAKVQGFVGEVGVEAVQTSDRRYRADLVVIGIGIVPNEELARTAGLTCDDGIIVDEMGRTSDPCIHAAGDCARSHHPFYNASIRLESVPGAVESARAVAASICGRVAQTKEVPWFWSHQFELRIQSAGTWQGADEVFVNGEPQGHSFSYEYWKSGRLIGVDAINNARLYMTARKSIEPRQPAGGVDTRASPARQPQTL
jgi:3-phenylpropionate/trans-cinnamate dioxygenase ferredoxin reductase component